MTTKQTPRQRLKNSIHIWQADLSELPLTETMSKLLAKDELQRSNQFKFSKDKNHYSISRAILRIVVSHYLEKPAKELKFSYNRYGKPQINSLKFNLSHSQHCLLIAVCLDTDIGIDAEYLNNDAIDNDLAAYCLSKTEYNHWQQLPPKHRKKFFFNIWTAKEAIIKAQGLSIHYLQQMIIKPLTEQNLVMVSFDNDQGNNRPWCLKRFTPATDYLATLAFQGEEKPLIFYQLTTDHKKPCASFIKLFREIGIEIINHPIN